MRQVPAEIVALHLSVDDDGWFIHCLPGADSRIPEDIETLDFTLETDNGSIQLEVVQSSRYGGHSMGVELVGRKRRDQLRLDAARRFAKDKPFAVHAIRIAAIADAVTFVVRPNGWMKTGTCVYEREHAAERAA